jgi:hypothetical protein
MVVSAMNGPDGAELGSSWRFASRMCSSLGHPILQSPQLLDMAPNLAAPQRQMIDDMINSGELTTPQMADAAGYSVRAIKHIRFNLRCFGAVKAPWNGGGRPRSIMQQAAECKGSFQAFWLDCRRDLNEFLSVFNIIDLALTVLPIPAFMYHSRLPPNTAP